MATVSELMGAIQTSQPAPDDPVLAGAEEATPTDPLGTPESEADEVELGLVEEFRTAPPEDAAEALKQLVRRFMRQ